jgi:DNA-binding MarR family transcriptional regulator
MASDGQIKWMFHKMAESHPIEVFKYMDEVKAGIGAVLRLLYEADEPLSAGTISSKLGISTARVAVLLKKMTQKGMITKQQSPNDARVTMVELTAAGRANIERMKNELFAQMGLIIDKVGEERLKEYFEIGEEIRNIIKIHDTHCLNDIIA